MAVANRRINRRSANHALHALVVEAFRAAGQGVICQPPHVVLTSQPGHILKALVAALADQFPAELARIGGRRQHADTAMLVKPIALSQHGNRLVQGQAFGVQQL